MQPIKDKTGGYVALCITSVVWGSTWVVSKLGLKEQMPALEMASIRQVIGGLCFVLFFLLYKKFPLPTAKQFGWLIVMAVLMFVIANGLSTWSLNYIPTGLSSLIGALYPLSVVIIERVFYKNKNLTVLTFVGLLLGVTGIGIVFYEHAFNQHPQGFIFGVILSVTAMLAWSLGTIFIIRNKVDINPYYGIGWQMLIGSVLLFTLACATGPIVAFQHITVKVWLVIAYLVVMGSLMAFIAFIYSMKHLPAAIASLYAYINPLVAMIIGTFLLKEKLTMNIVWGSIVTLTGVFLVNYSIKRNREKIIAESER
jgi:drug/metabolite transporter (DMT)-like permease